MRTYIIFSCHQILSELITHALALVTTLKIDMIGFFCCFFYFALHRSTAVFFHFLLRKNTILLCGFSQGLGKKSLFL